MAITAAQVKELREATGVGMMECKKALTETNGDMEKAMEWLRKKGIASAEKKSGRVAAEGVVEAYIHMGGKIGVMVEVNCETDFVAKTDKFLAFVKQIAKQIADTNPADVDALMATTMDGDTVEHAVSTAVAGIGEKISIRRFVRIEGAVDTYIHMGGRIGVVVQFSAPCDKEAMHDVALQIAAANPVCVGVKDLPQDYIDHERKIQLAKALEENAQAAKPKPQAIVEKMVDGRMSKYYKEVCLLEQVYVKDQGIAVKDMLKAKNASEVVTFVRYEMGEGLQKREDNFAEEVMSQMKA